MTELPKCKSGGEVRLAGLQLNELYFDDLFAHDYLFDGERRICSLTSNAAIWRTAKPAWLGPGVITISDWSDAWALRLDRDQFWVDYSLSAPFNLTNLRELLVTKEGVFFQGDGGHIDEFWFKYYFTLAKISAVFELDDPDTPEATKQHWLKRHDAI